MRTILLLFCCVSVFTLSAQNYITLQGKIIDSKTGKGIPYAHIGIPSKGLGVVSGSGGGFTLKVPNSYLPAKLSASFLGYKTTYRTVKDEDRQMRIELNRTAMDLQTVVVMDESKVEDIIRKAVRQIPKNYPTKPTNSIGFYRESKTNSAGEYVYLAEGVLEIYKTSYKNQREGQTGLIQGRQVALLPPEEMIRQTNFTSGHLSSHRFDFVKNREAFIQEKNFPSYQYWISSITEYNDRPVYEISFDRAGDDPNGRMKGKIFIDTLSYAFLRAEFEMLPHALRRSSAYPLYSGSWKANKYVVQYQQFNGKWHMKEALREGTWRDGGVYSNEFLVTEFKKGRGRYLIYEDRLGRNDAFLDVTGEYDEDFWKQYNTSPLTKALQETVRQLETKEKATEVFDSTFLARLETKRDSIVVSEGGNRLERAALKAGNPNRSRGKRKRNRVGIQWRTGIGIHQLKTPATNIGITYLDKQGQTIVSVNNNVELREYEYFAPFDLEFYFNNWFVRWGVTPEFFKNIYKNRSFGVGYQMNLTKRRPLLIRGALQHSRLIYATKIGQATNTYGDFKVGNKKFKSDKINMYYGSLNHNIKASLEVALEITPAFYIFAGASYELPFSKKEVAYLWERDRLWGFNRRKRIDVNDRVIVTKDDAPFEGEITRFNEGLIFQIGIIKR